MEKPLMFRTIKWNKILVIVGSVILLLCQSSYSAENDCDQCSQVCTTNSSNREVVCSCVDGFDLSSNNKSCIPKGPGVKIVYAVKDSIHVFNPNTNKDVTIIQSSGQNIGVAVDVRNGYVMWTDVTEKKEAVHRIKINGDGAMETVIDTGLILPEGIAYDWITGNIYITDSNRSHIIACSNDGAICSVIVQEHADRPREVALHPILGIMFWTNWGERASIIRAGMDGSTSLAIVTSDIKWPNSLAVDLGNSRLYWIDAFWDKIESSTLLGTDRKLVVKDNIHHPFSVKVFGDNLYWSDWHLNTVETCSKLSCNKTEIRSLINTTISGDGHPNGVTVFHPAAQPETRPNQCNNARCSHLCVLNGANSYTCVCPAGFNLDDTKRKCIDDSSKPKILIGYENSLKVLRFNSIGRNVIDETKLGALKSIGAVIYNPINKTAFVSDLFWKTIYEYNFKNRQLTSLTSRHLDSVKSLALDVIGENLYWADSARRRIEVLSLRTGARALLAMEAEHPQDIIVVPEQRLLFVSLTGRRGGRILRMNMNGYNRKTLVRATRGEPVSLTYNAELQKVFWCDVERDTIEHITISGKSQSIAMRSSGKPYSLTSFNNRIFWTDRHTQLLHTMPIFGIDVYEVPIFIGHSEDRYKTSLETYILGNFLAKVTMMETDLTRYENLTQHHECSPSHKPSKCSHICLLSNEVDAGTCVCPEGMTLKDDNLTCAWSATCSATQFQCHDKKCIDSEWKCDGFQDCDRGEDELNCTTTSACRSNDFICEATKTCVPEKWKCDGEKDCEDGSDESGCEKSTCHLSEFQCGNGHCIPATWKCDNQVDCKDSSDEKNCSHSCMSGSFKCATGNQCIPSDWVCDGDADCGDESDEHEHCDKSCTRGSFRCLSHHCIPLYLACNGVYDCDDRSDELDCKNFNSTTTPNPFFVTDEPDVLAPNTTDFFNTNSDVESCPWEHFSCFSGECVPFKLLCDGVNNCNDGSDEGPGCSTACKNVDECPHQCYKTPLGSKCSCHAGFEAEFNGKTCVDIDECQTVRPCQQVCINTKGSYKCACQDNYALRSDGKRCKLKSKYPKFRPSSGNTTSGESSEEVMEKHNAVPNKDAVGSNESGLSSGQTAGIVIGVILILLLITIIVGFILHKKRIHPKVFFERYGQSMLVKFKRRNNQVRRQPLGHETNYSDMLDGRSTYANGIYSNPVYDDVDCASDQTKARELGVSTSSNVDPRGKAQISNTGIMGVLNTDPSHLYEDMDDHYISYNQHDKLIDKEFV